jgi:hypothetical protein
MVNSLFRTMTTKTATLATLVLFSALASPALAQSVTLPLEKGHPLNSAQ